MDPLGLTYEELQLLHRLCSWVAINRCPPGFDLRAFLLGRMGDGHPDVAAKVRQLTDDQMLTLCREIMERQKLLR